MLQSDKRKSLAAAAFATVEQLETRRFKSASLDNGTLNVFGTIGNDTMYVYRDVTDATKIHAKVNGHIDTFNASEITAIYMEGRSGADVIAVLETNGGITTPARIYGGGGDDTIIGGYGTDKIFAGDGNDNVNGISDKDTIYGEGGDDSLRGGGGSDLIDGQDGNDIVRGDLGNDNLYGGTGVDRLRGSGGNDNMHGGASKDFMAGEEGDDSMFGEGGGDVMGGGGGNDVMDGGAIDDFIAGDAGDDVISGGGGSADSLFAGPGNDTFKAGDNSLERKDAENEDEIEAD